MGVLDPADAACAAPKFTNTLRIKHKRCPFHGFPVGFGPQIDTTHQIILQIQNEKSKKGHTIAQVAGGVD